MILVDLLAVLTITQQATYLVKVMMEIGSIQLMRLVEEKGFLQFLQETTGLPQHKVGQKISILYQEVVLWICCIWQAEVNLQEVGLWRTLEIALKAV